MLCWVRKGIQLADELHFRRAGPSNRRRLFLGPGWLDAGEESEEKAVMALPMLSPTIPFPTGAILWTRADFHWNIMSRPCFKKLHYEHCISIDIL